MRFAGRSVASSDKAASDDMTCLEHLGPIQACWLTDAIAAAPDETRCPSSNDCKPPAAAGSPIVLGQRVAQGAQNAHLDD